MPAKGPDLKSGDMIPGTKYRIVKSLGAGGMGVVYQVVKPPNIQGVLKLMSSDLTQHEEHRTRFFDEVRILAQLDHPNIVRVFDYDALPDGTPFYVMELLSGRTVRDVIHTMGRVPPRVAYEITRQLLEALQAAHTHEVPVIHRDIKPENIFLHAPRHGEPVVKLIDFGVSAVADRKHDGTFVGTWSYAAPEQIRGETPTPASDLYAAALVLYEMLAGVGPFDHYDDWAKVSEAQMKEVPAPVSKFAPWVPTSIVTLIQTTLAKDPRMRPRDAYAFAERLYELEWASDGKNPHDMTTEGPLPGPPGGQVAATGPSGAANVGAAKAAQIGGGGKGPLSRVLETLSGKPGTPSPAKGRIGDVPVLGAPPGVVRTASTWHGVGREDHTLPNTKALLAGLGAAGGKPPSKRERVSKPEGPAPAGAPEDAAPTPPRSPAAVEAGRHPSTAVTLEEVPAASVGANAGPATRDTFSSQQSDPGRRAAPRSRTGLVALAVALLLGGLVLATIVVVRGPRRDEAKAAAATTNEPEAASTNVAATIATAVAVEESPPPLSSAATSNAPPLGAVPVTATAHHAPTKPGHTATPGAGAKIPGREAASGAAAAHPEAPAASNGENVPRPEPKATGGGDFIRHF